MSDQTKAKASGPMWGTFSFEGRAFHAGQSHFMDSFPCRILPGHGKWVPVELVEAIEQAWGEFQDTGRLSVMVAAIRAAREGAI